MPIALSEFNLSHIKLSNPLDCPTVMDHRRRLALRLGQDDIDEILGRRHGLNAFEVIYRHFILTCVEFAHTEHTRKLEKPIFEI